MNFVFLCILTVIVCIALIAITMVQNSRKDDESNTLGNLGVHILMGVKQTNDFLTGTTWILMISLFLLCFGFHHVIKNHDKDIISPNLEIVKKQQNEKSEKMKDDLKDENNNDSNEKKLNQKKEDFNK